MPTVWSKFLSSPIYPDNMLFCSVHVWATAFLRHCLQADLEATAFNGRDRSELLSFLDCLHCARRLHAKMGLVRNHSQVTK